MSFFKKLTKEISKSIYSLEYFSGGDKVDPKKERRGKYLHVRYNKGSTDRPEPIDSGPWIPEYNILR